MSAHPAILANTPQLAFYSNQQPLIPTTHAISWPSNYNPPRHLIITKLVPQLAISLVRKPRKVDEGDIKLSMGIGVVSPEQQLY